MPTVADVETIAKTLGSIMAGKPQRHGALTVIPILAPMQAEPEWVTLAEAGDRVRITEVDDEGSVPELRVANLGDLPLLLLDGEQLVGAKQNRILNMTVRVAAQSKFKRGCLMRMVEALPALAGSLRRISATAARIRGGYGSFWNGSGI